MAQSYADMTLDELSALFYDKNREIKKIRETLDIKNEKERESQELKNLDNIRNNPIIKKALPLLKKFKKPVKTKASIIVNFEIHTNVSENGINTEVCKVKSSVKNKKAKKHIKEYLSNLCEEIISINPVGNKLLKAWDSFYDVTNYTQRKKLLED